MSGDIDSIRIAAEARGIFINPGERAANLTDHRHQIATGFRNLHEIDDDEMGPGIDEQFCRKSEVFRLAVAPCSAMNVDVHGRMGARGFVDVEFFDFTRDHRRRAWARLDAPGSP